VVHGVGVSQAVAMQSSQRVYAPVNFAANNARRAKCHPCRRLLDKVVAIACESAGPQKPAVETHPKPEEQRR